jgi:hypothetical protein
MKHKAPRDQFDLVFTQIACMTELARQAHPSEAFVGDTPEKARMLLDDVEMVRNWFHAAAQYAVCRPRDQHSSY